MVVVVAVVEEKYFFARFPSRSFEIAATPQIN